jgi:hypothetical protein
VLIKPLSGDILATCKELKATDVFVGIIALGILYKSSCNALSAVLFQSTNNSVISA